MDFVLKCVNPKCGQVVEWSGAQVLAERERMITEAKKAGGSGLPKMAMQCPRCGAELARAERLASEEVRAAPAGPDPMAAMLEAQKARAAGKANSP